MPSNAIFQLPTLLLNRSLKNHANTRGKTEEIHFRPYNKYPLLYTGAVYYTVIRDIHLRYSPRHDVTYKLFNYAFNELNSWLLGY